MINMIYLINNTMQGFWITGNIRKKDHAIVQLGQFVLDGKCLLKCIVYQANVIANNERKAYFRTPEWEFELHFINHTMSFRHKNRVNDTELSKYLWKLKEKNVDYKLP